MEANNITGLIVDCCIKIHTTIGPGCYERVYEELLYYELNKINLDVKRQITMPISYEVFQINDAYKLDLLIENKVIIEIKSVEHVLPVHFKQLNTYLKLMNLKHGMLLNFKVGLMKDGIHRVFNNFGNE
ncbi:MAG: GxxExxY protein [Bacteroidota bacterium]|nr:GxxExxY protein [Bacteroidota bacterium]